MVVVGWSIELEWKNRMPEDHDHVKGRTWTNGRSLKEGVAGMIGEKGGVPSRRRRRECYATRIHAHRVARRDCDHRHPGGDPVPGVCSGAGEGATDNLYLEHEATGPRDRDVRPGL